ncbi:MAG: hypothetical protein H7210_05100 [Pyrinomonadaceae bacterium]|nr:hypothetical protein [Phycisphaerales bacterium]
MATFSDPFITVTATNASGTGTFSVPLSDVTINPMTGSGMYILPGAINVMNGPIVIATITQMTSFVRPQAGNLPNLISLGFTMRAGSSATTFVVDSTLFGINPIINEAGRTSGGITITDQNNNGAAFTGNNVGGGAFNPYYNGATPGTGTAFTSVLLADAVGNGGTHTMNMAVPGGGIYTPLPNVTSMSSRWNFILTAADQVGVTSVWEVIPAPGSISLLAFGGLAMARRSRR